MDVELDSTVGALAGRAQLALAVGRGRLLNSSGRILDEAALIKTVILQQGDFLTLQLGTVQVHGAPAVFAAILGDGSLVTWGDSRFGGDSDAVQDQLKCVQQVQSNMYAFAAILDDGSVVTWGDEDCGGDSAVVQKQLKDSAARTR